MNALIRFLSEFAHATTRSVPMESQLKSTLQQLEEHILNARPIRVSRDINWTCIVFTDGSYEPSSEHPAAIGGVLISPHGVLVKFFGECVNQQIVSSLFSDSAHPIYELEILPVLIAASIWKHHLSDALVVFYLDNEAASSPYIQGTAATQAGQQLLRQFVSLEAACHFFPWFGRVASASNPADPPSRMCFDVNLLRTGQRIHVCLPSHLEDVGLASGVLGIKSPAFWCQLPQCFGKKTTESFGSENVDFFTCHIHVDGLHVKFFNVYVFAFLRLRHCGVTRF